LQFDSRNQIDAKNKGELRRSKYSIEPRVTRTFSAYTMHEEGSSCIQKTTNIYLDPK